MLETYRRTRSFVLLAGLAVFLASGLIVNAFYAHVTTPCLGTLERVPLASIAPQSQRREVLGNAGVFITWDLVPTTDPRFFDADDPRSYRNVRLVWTRDDKTCGCKDLAIPLEPNLKSARHPLPPRLVIHRDVDTDVFIVTEPKGDDVMAYRMVVHPARRFDRKAVFQTNNVSMLVLFGAIGALAAALALLGRAVPYVTRMTSWRPGALRGDGMIENESGALVGRLRGRLPIGPLLIDPKAVDGRDVYRDMPTIERRDVAAGTHDRWIRGTYRRLRDAKTLAVLASVTTALAVGAHFFA